MRNKQNDIPYLGCRSEKINSACPVLNVTNFEHLHRWVTDRYAVHVKKDVEKKPAPWTNNPVIRAVNGTGRPRNKYHYKEEI